MGVDVAADLLDLGAELDNSVDQLHGKPQGGASIVLKPAPVRTRVTPTQSRPGPRIESIPQGLP
jgi:hypothetical protein